MSLIKSYKLFTCNFRTPLILIKLRLEQYEISEEVESIIKFINLYLMTKWKLPIRLSCLNRSQLVLLPTLLDKPLTLTIVQWKKMPNFAVVSKYWIVSIPLKSKLVETYSGVFSKQITFVRLKAITISCNSS
jgi:hypothetical protein